MVYDRHQITLDHKCPLSIALLSLSERMYTNLVIFINGCQKYDGLYTFKAVDPLSSLRPLPSNINHPTSVTTVIVKSCHQPGTRLVFHASVRLTWKPPPSSSEMCTPQFQWSVHEPEAHPQLLECRLADKGHPDGQNSFRKKEKREYQWVAVLCWTRSSIYIHICMLSWTNNLAESEIWNSFLLSKHLWMPLSSQRLFMALWCSSEMSVTSSTSTINRFLLDWKRNKEESPHCYSYVIVLIGHLAQETYLVIRIFVPDTQCFHGFNKLLNANEYISVDKHFKLCPISLRVPAAVNDSHLFDKCTLSCLPSTCRGLPGSLEPLLGTDHTQKYGTGPTLLSLVLKHRPEHYPNHETANIHFPIPNTQLCFLKRCGRT